MGVLLGVLAYVLFLMLIRGFAVELELDVFDFSLLLTVVHLALFIFVVGVAHFGLRII